MDDAFEWDEAKDAANRLKHGFGFSLAREFDWPGAVYRDDDRRDYKEVRRLAFGFVGDRAFAIVFVVRNARIRVISLRPMHSKEMKKYGLKASS